MTTWVLFLWFATSLVTQEFANEESCRQALATVAEDLGHGGGVCVLMTRRCDRRSGRRVSI